MPKRRKREGKKLAGRLFLLLDHSQCRVDRGLRQGVDLCPGRHIRQTSPSDIFLLDVGGEREREDVIGQVEYAYGVGDPVPAREGGVPRDAPPVGYRGPGTT